MNSGRSTAFFALLLSLSAPAVLAAQEKSESQYEVRLSLLSSRVLGDRFGIEISVTNAGGKPGPAVARAQLVGATSLLVAQPPTSPGAPMAGVWSIPDLAPPAGGPGVLFPGEQFRSRAWFKVPASLKAGSPTLLVQWVGSGPLDGLRSNQVTLTVAENKTPVVSLETSEGNILVELWPDKAPNHVANFLELTDKGFYDGLVFHRIIPNFMIQGGCPDGNGMGGPGYSIAAEFNDAEFSKGVLGMARSSSPDSAGSQFFICVDDAPHLNKKYTAFGRVLEGQDVADGISRMAKGPSDRPLTEISLHRIVPTLPEDYKRPEVAKLQN